MEKKEMSKYLMLITYSFDTEYVAVPCDTEEEAIKVLNKYLDEEIRTVIEESDYAPTVREFDETEKELSYESEAELINMSAKELLNVDKATYKVIEIGHGVLPKKERSA